MSIWTRFLGGSSRVEHRSLTPAVGGSTPPLPTISRRAFLGGAAAVAVAAPTITRAFFLPPRGGWPVSDFTTDALRYKTYERHSVGWTDPKAVFGTPFGCESCKPISAAEFSRIAEPGARKFWAGAYDNHCQEWEALYGDDGVSLSSTAHPGSESFTEADRQLVEEGGWKCVNGHPYCNRCASPVELSQKSLEDLMIDIKKQFPNQRLSLDPTQAWFIKPEHEAGLKRFERQAPIRVSPGRRWWK